MIEYWLLFDFWRLAIVFFQFIKKLEL